MNKNFKLSDESETNNVEYLKSLEKEIKDIEKKLNNPKKEATKRLLLLKYKTLLCKLRYNIPFISYYSATAVITAITMAALNSDPFAIDLVDRKLYTKEELDCFGNHYFTKQYDEFDYEIKNVIKYTVVEYYDGFPTYRGDNIYSEETYFYDVSDLTRSQIIVLFPGITLHRLREGRTTTFHRYRKEISETFYTCKDILDDKLGEPHFKEPKKINVIDREIDPDKLREGGYMYGTIHDQKVVKEEQSDLKMKLDILIYIAIVGLLGPKISSALVSKFQADYKKRLKLKLLEIEERYPKIDFIELRQRLDTKKENIKSLTR